MRDKTDIRLFSEFAFEIVLGVPYAYWLHQHNQLGTVYTVEGMKPFYYFADNVVECYTTRTHDNGVSGISKLPNTWIHHSRDDYAFLSDDEKRLANGVLAYDKWLAPPYADIYKTDRYSDLGNYVVVNNCRNVEYGYIHTEPYRTLSPETLREIFQYFSDRGMNVIYKRPTNTEFHTDENERMTLTRSPYQDDFVVCGEFDNVYVIDKLIGENYSDYNTKQLELFATAKGFITVNGGGGILCAYFRTPVVMYVPDGKELRPGYLENDNSYIKMLSGAPIYPVYARVRETGQHNYEGLLEQIRKIW